MSAKSQTLGRPSQSTAALAVPAASMPHPVDATAPSIEAQLDQAARFGHRFGQRASASGPPALSAPIQPKLTVGAPDDPYEREADRMAGQVMRTLATNQPLLPLATGVQAQPAAATITPLAQRAPQPSADALAPAAAHTEAAPSELDTALDQARAGGQPLDDHIRQPMQQAFGSDFSGVRVHTDTQAGQLSEAIQARAFTSGRDIFMGPGEYQPQSQGGQELLAHELTHVLQQRAAAPTHSAAPYLQRKLSLNKTAIPHYDPNMKLFGKESLSVTISKLTTLTPTLTILDIIRDMCNDHYTHVFFGTIPEQKDALAAFMTNVGASLPRTHRQLKELQMAMSKTKSGAGEHYEMIATVRHDRPTGLAAVEEVGLSRNKEGEANLRGFNTQVVDTPGMMYNDAAPRKALVERADEDSIKRGIYDRISSSYGGDQDEPAVAYGFGAATERIAGPGPTKQLRTQIRWASAESDEGTDMIADPLGPDHPLGSTPGGGNKPWHTARQRMQDLTAGQETYIAGHLLNEQLGGPGDDARNLAPITSEGNAKHKEQVENSLKRMINKQLLWMYYEVHTQRLPLDLNAKAKYTKQVWGDGKYTARFDCIWGRLDEDGKRITSDGLTLNFTDPTRLAGATPVGAVRPANTTLANHIPTGSAAASVHVPIDIRRVVLNTALKTRSYLIAAQTLLPEYDKLTGQITAQTQSFSAVNQAISDYIAADLLDDSNAERLEKAYDMLYAAVESDDEMEAIYAQDLNDIDEYVTVMSILHSALIPAANTAKLATKAELGKIATASSELAFRILLGAINKLIEEHRHPMQKAIETTLHQFMAKHSVWLTGDYYRKRRKAKNRKQDLLLLEREVSALDRDVRRLEGQQELWSTELGDAEQENRFLRAENERLRRQLEERDFLQALEIAKHKGQAAEQEPMDKQRLAQLEARARAQEAELERQQAEIRALRAQLQQQPPQAQHGGPGAPLGSGPTIFQPIAPPQSYTGSGGFSFGSPRGSGRPSPSFPREFSGTTGERDVTRSRSILGLRRSFESLRESDEGSSPVVQDTGKSDDQEAELKRTRASIERTIPLSQCRAVAQTIWRAATRAFNRYQAQNNQHYMAQLYRLEMPMRWFVGQQPSINGWAIIEAILDDLKKIDELKDAATAWLTQWETINPHRTQWQ